MVLVVIAQGTLAAVAEACVYCLCFVLIVLALNPLPVHHAVRAVFGVVVPQALVNLFAVKLVYKVVGLLCREAMPLICAQSLLVVQVVDVLVCARGAAARLSCMVPLLLL